MSGPTAPKPIALTDDQLAAIFRATEPLEPLRRSAFLIALAQMLRGEPEIGDGSLFRCILHLQREFHDPLSVSSPTSEARSRRKVGRVSSMRKRARLKETTLVGHVKVSG
jgi:hypothetical protein